MFDLDNYVPYLVRRIVPRMDEAFSANLEAVGLTIETWRVLITLHDRGSLTLTAVAELTSINLSTLSRIADRMERDKLLRRVTRADSGRRWVEVEMMPLGIRKCELLIPEAMQFHSRAIASFSESELKQFKSLLRRFYSGVAEVAKERTSAYEPMPKRRRTPKVSRQEQSRQDLPEPQHRGRIGAK